MAEQQVNTSGQHTNAATAKKRCRSLEDKLTRDREKHCMREPCDCPRACISLIDQKRRDKIYLEFWRLPYNERKNFLHHSVDRYKPKTYSTSALKKKEASYAYRMTDQEGRDRVVCKKFFLGTIGYGETSNVVAIAKRSPDKLTATPDQRGQKRSQYNYLHERIEEHIKSYHPCISHYLHDNPPSRLYLPHELTVTEMHKNYNESPSENSVDYSTYLRRVNSLNINFARVGEEECETCTMLNVKQHERVGERCTETCYTCVERKDHEDHAREAVRVYLAEGSTVRESKMVRSVDMQKAMMLPQLPGHKSACFVRGLVVFHHTYAPVGEFSKTSKPLSVVWNESISGRKCEDIASAFNLALLENRDDKELVYFMHNSASQNKNYTLFTTLIRAVNGTRISADRICLKYLEAGHTVTSAHNYHTQVDKQMKKREQIYDFKDFTDCISQTGATLITPTYSDFRQHDAELIQPQLQKACGSLLDEIRIVEFRRGCWSVFYKKRYSDTDFAEFDYLQVRYDLTEPAANLEPRGVSASKKDNIVENLLPFMPETRRDFWRELPSAEVRDLIDNFE